jgi:hypothetical protein
MTESNQPARPQCTLWNRIAWAVFGFGVLCPALVFVVADNLSHPAWAWDSSYFGRYLATPLWIFGFVCCVLSPHFTQLSSSWKMWTMFIGIGAYGIVFVVSLIVSMVVFGMGIR